MIELPSGVVVISKVDLDSEFSFFEGVEKGSCGGVDVCLFSLKRNRNNDNLNICDSRR